MDALAAFKDTNKQSINNKVLWQYQHIGQVPPW